jgi:hypothetical protein
VIGSVEKIEVSLLYYPIPLKLVNQKELEMEPIEIYTRSIDVPR